MLTIGAVLIATDVIDTGKTTEVVRQAPIVQPASDAGDGETDGGGRTVQDIYKEEGRGVVFVEARGSGTGDPTVGPSGEGRATGSGFVVDRDGTIVTNAHVVEGSAEVTVQFEDGGETVDAEVLGRDPDTDLAVLRIDPSKVKDLTALPLGDAKSVQVGDPVVAIGNPFGFTRTVTTGIVSALAREIEAPTGFAIPNVIQTDAAINPGNSGGPLLDAQGRVIGINSQIATGGGQGSVGIGFAIPIDTARKLLPRLKQGGEIEHAYLGIEMTPVSEDLAQDFNLPVDSGALIQKVVEGSPADKAGLRGGRTQTADGALVGGDLLVKVDGRAIGTSTDVLTAISDNAPGDSIQVEYYRGDEKRTATVTLADRPDDAQSGQPQDQQAPEDDGGGLLPFP